MNINEVEKYVREVIEGETVLLDNTEENKILYNAICDELQLRNIHFVSGDIDEKYPEEQYYIELA